WPPVISALTATYGDGRTAPPGPDHVPLTKQQRAWLLLVKPLTLAGGFALLSAPSSFARDAIERVLRDPITEALSRHLGQQVDIAVRIDPEPDTDPAPEPEAVPRSETTPPPPNGPAQSAPDPQPRAQNSRHRRPETIRAPMSGWSPRNRRHASPSTAPGPRISPRPAPIRWPVPTAMPD